MRIGIVVVVYAEYPALLFESLRGKTKHQIHWYIHSHTADKVIERQLVTFCQDNTVSLMLHRLNRGLAKSWNDGIIESYNDRSDITAVINDDVVFRPSAFDKWIDFIHSYDGLGLAFLHGLESDGSPHEGTVRTQDYACFALGPSAFNILGAFDENFFPAYREDMDYALRAEKAHVPFVTDTRTLVDHARNKTTRRSPELQLIMNDVKDRNRDYFIRKWGDEFGNTTLDLPFGHKPLKVEWTDRRTPYGSGFDRPELSALEPGKQRVRSFPVQDSRLTPERLVSVVSPHVQPRSEAEGKVQAIFQALLGRNPESAALENYATRLLSGHHSVRDLCEIVRGSDEFKSR